MPVLVGGDFTLVTKNSIDFRGKADDPGVTGHFAKQDIPAGLICLNGPQGMDLDMQKELFEVALDALESVEDLINKALEITLEHEHIVTRLYDVPRR